VTARDIHREDAEAIRLVALAWQGEARLCGDTAQAMVLRIRADTALECARHLEMIAEAEGAREDLTSPDGVVKRG
jgi:hypothetical protein